MFNSSNGYSLSDIAAVTGSQSRNGSGDGFGENGSWWIIILFLFAFMNDGWGNGKNGGGNGSGGNFGWGGYPYPVVVSTDSGSSGGVLTRSALAQDMNFAGIDAGIRGIQTGLCDGFYAMNTGMLNGFAGVDNAICTLGYNTQQGFSNMSTALMQGQNALATQLSNCCCDTRDAIKTASYDNLLNQNAISRQIADCCCETGRAIEKGFADTNYNMATTANALQTALASSTRDIIDSQNAGTRAILDYLCQEKIADLQAENQTLKFAASQAAQNTFITANQEAQTAELIRRLGRDCPVPAYVVPNPNCCYGNYGLTAFNSCGC